MKQFNVQVSTEQHKKMKLLSFYSGKSIATIIREIIDALPEKDYGILNSEGGDK